VETLRRARAEQYTGAPGQLRWRKGEMEINSPPVSRVYPNEPRVRPGYRRARRRSAAGRAAGSRTAPYYRRRGGTVPRDPAEGRGRRAIRPPEGPMGGHRAPGPSQRDDGG
jgi:hypothetical protein